MALRSVTQVCTSNPGIITSGGQFDRIACSATASVSQFPQLNDGKVEDGFQVAVGLGGNFMIGGPGLQQFVSFNPQQNFNHPTTGQLIYKNDPGILTGITSILNPLAAAGANIFAAQQQIDVQRAALKSGAGFPQQQPVFIAPPKKSNTGIIIAVVAIVVVVGIIMMSQGSEDNKG